MRLAEESSSSSRVEDEVFAIATEPINLADIVTIISFFSSCKTHSKRDCDKGTYTTRRTYRERGSRRKREEESEKSPYYYF